MNMQCPDRFGRLKRSAFLTITTFVILAALAAHAAAGGDDDVFVWRPVTPEELAMKAPSVEQDADAEAIFWEVWLDDKKESSVYYDHYVRVKIFTERGRERFSKFDIPFIKGHKIENIAARVIRPDGSIVSLDPKDIFERDIVSAGRIKLKARSFAIPGIQPGVIVEYRYRERFKDSWVSGVRLNFQRDIPMQKIAFHVRPQKGFTLLPRFHNMSETQFVQDPSQKGFLVASLRNVPAYKIEPHMPPEDEVRKWAFLSYFGTEPAIVWRGASRTYSHWLANYANPTDLIRRKAAELTANATTDDGKLRSIYQYTQKGIRNLDFDGKITEEEREKLKFDHAEDVIKRGMGNSVYIELLFASLARALGYEVRLVASGDRSDSFFSPDKHPYRSFIHFACVGVKLGANWRYFNSSVPYLPFGRLAWHEEGVTAMHVSDETYVWKDIPISDHYTSPASRTGKFTLAEDGTLEGTVRTEYFGHQAISRRRDSFRESDSKRREDVIDEIKARISTAEVSDVVIEHIDDMSKPLTYSWKIRIPNYAQRTGSRLFLQPGFFERGEKPVFSAAGREHSIHFAYPWSESDSVEIALPKGFDLESSDSPAAVQDPRKIGNLKVLISFDKDSRTIKYNRDFHFGGGGFILFPAASYTALKGLFDAFHTADSHIVTLKATK